MVAQIFTAIKNQTHKTKKRESFSNLALLGSIADITVTSYANALMPTFQFYLVVRKNVIQEKKVRK